MNLILGKNLLDNMSMIFDTLFKREHIPTNYNIKIYTDAINGDALASVPMQHVIFTSESMINILDKISNAIWNESISIVTDGERLQILLNTLLNGTESQRNSALDKLVQMGIILASDTNMIRALTSEFINYDKNNLVKTFEVTESDKYHQYKYDIPLGLVKSYDKVRNTSNEKLYLLFVNYTHQQFGSSPIAGESYSYFINYWDSIFMKNSLTLCYGAVDIGDIALPADAENSIQYDHLDKIEYFDNFVVQIKVPNQFK